MAWKSVDIILPDAVLDNESDMVIVMNNNTGFIVSAFYSYGKQEWQSRSRTTVRGITHWMKIPKI